MLDLISALALFVVPAGPMEGAVGTMPVNDQVVASHVMRTPGTDGGTTEVRDQFAAPSRDERENDASRAAFFELTTDADAVFDDVDHTTRRLLLVGMLALVCFTAWLAFRSRTRPIPLDRLCVGASAALAPALFMTLGPAVGCLSIALTLMCLVGSRRIPLDMLSAVSHVVLLLVLATKFT